MQERVSVKCGSKNVGVEISLLGFHAIIIIVARILVTEFIIPFYACTAPNDYMALNSILLFTVGQSVGDVVCTNLDIVDDMAIERDGEDVILSLSPVEPAVTVVTASSATVAIIENDNDGKHKMILIINELLDMRQGCI